MTVVDLRTLHAEDGAYVSVDDVIIFIDQFAENLKGNSGLSQRDLAAVLATMQSIKKTLRTLEQT